VLGVDLAAPVAVDRADLVVVADGRHSVPTQLRLEVDGVPARTITVPEIADAGEPGATQAVPVTFEPVTGRQLRLVIEAVRPVTTIDDRTRAAVALPVSVVEAGLAGVPVPAAPAELPDVCRDDLLRVDGDAVPVRIVGAAADARTGLAVAPCGGSLALDAGSHTLRAAPGLDTGIDVDRVVLSSDASGAPTAVAPLGAPLDASGAQVRVVDEGEASFDLRVRTDGTPFWLVLGQSQSDGWEAETGDGRSLGTSQLVDGYANGWQVDPGDAGVMTITLRWTPQGIVWIGMAISALAVLACLGIVVVTRRRTPVALEATPALTSPLRYATPTPRVGVAVGAAVVAALGAAAISRWWIGAIAGIAALLTTWAVAGRINAGRINVGRIVLAAGAPLALALSKAAGEPELGWLAVALLATDLLVGWVRQRWRTREPS
jgi:hypothetical protein